jgi:adenine C2-methylase RlmN of 23S rRNA A2503 and tRNA A37
MGKGRQPPTENSIWDTKTVLSIPGMKQVHAQKIWKYLIERPTSVTDLTVLPYDTWSVPLKVQAIIKNTYKLGTATVVKASESAKSDTTKLLLQLHDDHHIESVIIRHVGHSTLCVSSQIGCKMGCKFCATGE